MCSSQVILLKTARRVWHSHGNIVTVAMNNETLSRAAKKTLAAECPVTNH